MIPMQPRCDTVTQASSFWRLALRGHETCAKCGRKLTLRPDIDADIGLSALLAAFLAICFLPDDDLVAYFAAVLGMIFATQLSLTYAAAALTPITHHDRSDMAAGRYRLHIALLLILVLFVAALLWLSNMTR